MTMRKLLLLFKMAWCAFWLIPFDVQYEPFHYYCQLKKDAGICDNQYRTGCKNEATIALAETTCKFEMNEGNYYHLCMHCALEVAAKGGKQKEPYQE
jgi:hypothetical protein